MKIEDLLKEINELLEDRKQLNWLKESKKEMADKLLEYELKEFELTTIKDRKQNFINECCKCCRFNCENKEDILPDDIGKPIKSKNDYFPAHKSCEDFQWD